MGNSRYYALLTLAVLSVLQLGSQSAQPSIAIASLPAWGQDGVITGTVTGGGTQAWSAYTFAFIPDIGWTGVPDECVANRITNGQFTADASQNTIYRTATRFSVYLLPQNNVPSCDASTAAVPFAVQHSAVAVATIPRVAQTPTISFAGMDWYVKDSSVKVYPGPQWFVSDNVYVDGAGQLHLKVAKCGSEWCAAEVYTTQNVGYGAYQFTINSALNNLDPNLTFGVFTWDGQDDPDNHQEWDMEFGKWGNANSSFNAQYVVQPYNGPNNIYRFPMSGANPSTHTVNWTPQQVSFSSAATAVSLISQWTFNSATSRVPTPGDVRLHLNLYVGSGGAPQYSAPQEIVISAMQYTPYGAQIGFGRTADTAPFQAGTYSVPLTSTGAACAAEVESDSPWISIAGSNTIQPGTPVQYSVASNNGAARTGHLILQSSSCNAALGAQMLTVTQSAVVCSPGFALPSTHTGYFQETFPVAIKTGSTGCAWTVSTSDSWLHVTSANPGAGDGNIQVQADLNPQPTLRQAWISLSNGPMHTVYQDGSSSMLAISPKSVATCGVLTAPFGFSWSSPGSIEFHLNSPTGQLLGQFGSSGTTTLTGLSDGQLIFMLPQSGASAAATLASARASVDATTCGVASIAPLGIVNAASYAAGSLAPGSLATVFGANLSTSTAQATGSPYPTTLGGASVTIGGQACPMWYASGGQINFAVPASVAAGRTTLTVGAASSEVLVTAVAPGLFTLRGDGTGVPLASITGIASDGSTFTLAPYTCAGSTCARAAMTIPANATDLYLVLYGTGIRNSQRVSATLGGLPLTVQFAGSQPQYPGLDQVNLHLGAPFDSLHGVLTLALQADGAAANPVVLEFQ